MQFSIPAVPRSGVQTCLAYNKHVTSLMYLSREPAPGAVLAGRGTFA